MLLASAVVLSLALTGCATSSASAVSRLIAAARDGDSAEIQRLTSNGFPQEDLAVVVSYALEGCSWESVTVSADSVHGTFTCPEDGQLGTQDFQFSMARSRITSIDTWSR